MRSRNIAAVVAVVAVLLAAVYAPTVTGALLMTFSFVAFVWAVVGLYRPEWARLPNRMASVWVWALSVGLLIGGAAIFAPPEDAVESSNGALPPPAATNPAVVNAETWTDGPWPLTVSGGVLTCTQFNMGGITTEAVFIVTDDGSMWPLNGAASSRHDMFGAEPSVDPIWRENPEIPGTRILISSLISRARLLC